MMPSSVLLITSPAEVSGISNTVSLQTKIVGGNGSTVQRKNYPSVTQMALNVKTFSQKQRKAEGFLKFIIAKLTQTLFFNQSTWIVYIFG